ncbi:MAG: hypothetical protein V3U34_00515 [candidate division NC10 bacterium]
MSPPDTLLLIGQGLALLAVLWGACALATWSDNRGRARRGQ